jgi:uncharacterized membrane protein SpoIIM required for sporulation
VIVDLAQFIDKERPYWTKLEAALGHLERDPFYIMTLDAIKEFHYLYNRASSDLVKVSGFSADADIRRYVESLVGRAYSQVHGVRGKTKRTPLVAWVTSVFPRTFRTHLWAFSLSLAIVLFGAVTGSAVLSIDKQSKAIILPFEHLKGDPAERVAQEEKADAAKNKISTPKSSFSAFLITNNTSVSISVFALGFTWGIGTVIMLFYNGLILGAVALDYVVAGKTAFLLGWLLPHGVIEIPAVIIAGQAGLLVAATLIGRRSAVPLRARFRRIGGDLVTLLIGLALMLVWAGIVEAFFSQYHEPILPYTVKITFGLIELAALVAYLGFAGRSVPPGAKEHHVTKEVSSVKGHIVKPHGRFRP